METALVTGASRGIGREIARDLARRAYGLTISSRTEEDLALLAATRGSDGSPQVARHALDLADRGALPVLVEAHEHAFGSMDALILSGGVGTAGRFNSISPHRIDKTVSVNLTSAISLIQQSLRNLSTFLRHVLEQTTGADSPSHRAC